MSVHDFVDAAKDTLGTCIATTSVDRIDKARLRELRVESFSSCENRKDCSSVERDLRVCNGLVVVTGTWNERLLKVRSGSKTTNRIPDEKVIVLARYE
jgi:hypothetical protein